MLDESRDFSEEKVLLALTVGWRSTDSGDPSLSIRQFCEDLVASRPIASVSPVEADDLAAAVVFHGLSGLAVESLNRVQVLLPDAASSAIRRNFMGARRWAAMLDLECERIGRAAAVSDHSLSPPILLKGEAVARRYQNPEVRGYGDIDLLVPRDELEAWGQFLEKLGYAGLRGWHELHARRYEHHLPYRRPVGNLEILCELHTCTFMEHRARELDYSVLVEAAEPSKFTGIVELEPGTQLVVLALHLFHHRHDDRRLIWFRDFLELGKPRIVEIARLRAAKHGVGWALEWALHEVEKVVGLPIWQAEPEEESFGLARVLGFHRPGHLYQLAFMRELGPLRAVQYLVSRVNPRRFRDSPEGSTRAALKVLVLRNLRAALDTPWLKYLWRRL